MLHSNNDTFPRRNPPGQSELRHQLEFWKAHLAGAPTLLDLPTDRPRPAVQSYRGDTIDFGLPMDLIAGLRRLSQRHDVTLFMTLLAAWAVLMSRLSGQQDVVIGAPIANRQRSELKRLIGFFVNTLALRVRLDDNPSVAELLAQVKVSTLEALAHQDVPFQHVAEAVRPARDLGHSPLFQVMLAMNDMPRADGLTLAGLSASGLEQADTTAQFDLTLSLDDTGDAVLGALEYATDLFDRSTIERIAGHFRTLLAGMVTDDQQRVERLPLLTDDERQQIVFGFNDTAAAYPSDRLIQQLFEAQAATRSDAVAVVFEDRQLSYDELNRRANRLAHHLIALGVRPDDRVAICIERSLEMVVGLLGILKAGGAYVPLDPSYPADRLAYMLEDSEPVALLTQSAVHETLPSVAVRTVLLDETADAMLLARQSEHDPDPLALGLTPQHLAYVIYTSGSTGLPKGVAMSQRALVNLINWHQRPESGLAAPERTIQFSALGFDVAFQETFSTLCAGGCLVLVDEATRRDPASLMQMLMTKKIERIFLPFVALETLSEAAADSNADLPHLRNVITAGERLRTTPAISRLIRQADHCRLHNHYGPTESHVVTALTLGVDPNGWTVMPPIGRPIGNTQIYILDARGAPVPIGVIGEIYIGGVGVARGYLNRPDLTAERFVNDPFSLARAAILYKTGDFGRWLSDGNIDFLGRNDSQVKIRGFRIELGEIEARLAACFGVREAVAVAREDNPGDKRLVAYLTPQAGCALSAAELRRQLSSVLPDYMIPSAFVTLASFPLTPNGKLDRKALPAPDQVSVASHPYETPVGETETIVAALWRSLLGVERIGRHDHFFFDLGGHSLIAVRLVALIKKRMGLDLPIAALFRAPTVERLSALIAQQQAATHVKAPVTHGIDWSPLVEITQANGRVPLFCFHGAGGNVLNFADLAQELGPRQPMFGLQARGTDGRLPGFGSIQQMADSYQAEIQRVQPHGPYCLLGYSGGGAVAFEIARRLFDAGELVALLAMIDTLCPTASIWRAPLRERMHHGWSTGQLSAVLQSLLPFEVARRQMRKLRYHLGRYLAEHGHIVPIQLRDAYVATSFQLIYKQYRPRPYEGGLVLFRSTLKVPYRNLGQDLGWSRLVTGGVEIQFASGDHDTIMYGLHISAIATRLRETLASVNPSADVAEISHGLVT